jgi:uncharacterized protein (TIGR02147 family)
MTKNLRSLLLKELEERRRRNTMYSMRAFARDLGVGLGSLSEVLSGKRQLSKSNTLKIIQTLRLSQAEKESLLDNNRPVVLDERQLLAEDEFKLIADWYYLAILNLSRLKTNKADPNWIAERLNIEPYIVIEALERLQRLKFLKVERNRLVRTTIPLTTTTEIPSTAIRRHHSQNLLLAEHSLHNVAVDQREFGSVTMAVNMKNLQKAKELLLKTRKKVAALLEEGPTQEVYTLSFQLFPLTAMPEAKGTKKTKPS